MNPTVGNKGARARTRPHPERDVDDGDDPGDDHSSRATLRVALLDRDHRFVRPLSGAMRSAGWKVAELTDLPERSTLAAMRANVLLLDLTVVAADSGWLRRQLAETPELAIVACTAHSTVAERVRSLQEGFDGWIAKSCDHRELLARVQAIARARHGGGTVRPSIRAGEIDVSPSRYDAIVAGQRAGLTTREFEVLELLARQDGKVLDRKRIYSGVWGDAVPAGDRSVDIFVGRIRAKLGRISPAWRYLHTHPGVGYRFAAERLAGEQAPSGSVEDVRTARRGRDAADEPNVA